MTWYNKGFQAGKSGRYSDMYEGWKAAKGKPKRQGRGTFGPIITGRYVEAQEKFYEGFLGGQNWQSNPGGLLSKLKKGIRGHIKLSRGRLIIKT